VVAVVADQEYETYECVDGDTFDQIIAKHYRLTESEGGEAALINQVVEYCMDFWKNQNISRKPTFPVLNLGDVVYLPKLPDEMFKQIETEQIEIFNPVTS
jgi:hypothetical protein